MRVFFFMLGAFIHLTANITNAQQIWLEAECGVVGNNWQTTIDQTASETTYLSVISQTPHYSLAPSNVSNHLSFTFELSESGIYKIWGRVIAVSNSNDSFWVRMDDGNWIKWNSIVLGSTWQWDEIHDSNNGSQVVNFNLAAGTHTLDIALREPKTKLDKLFITNDGNAPSEFGNSAINCTAATIPATPDALSATATATTEIDLVWNHSGDNETGFEIERSTEPGSGFSLIATVGSDVLSYSDTGLLENTTYYYRVRAVNSDTSSAYSNESNATTLTNTVSAPDNLLASAVAIDQIDLTWNHSGNNETGFEIERSTEPGAGFTLITTVGSNTLSYSDINLLENTTYYYRVRAINNIISSGYSNESNATTLTNTVSAPDNLLASAVASDQIDLTWNHSGNNETGFEIERSTEPGAGFTLITTVGSNTLSYSDINLLENTTYYYRVRAINNIISSGYSNESNATTLTNTVSAPDNLLASAVASDQIDLTWNHSGNNETGFEIERSTEPG
ncbi:fibronectin type III domain-containing protein, partial [Fulvivirgaceae bacterium BMA10]|nr:fibronectin type III domain-containing protein [Fulvivirgaceae bacterium BMA10]